MNILSLFDGMACGMIAMQLAGVDVESYDAYEIDKYAIKTAQHNFPMIKEHGDVFETDFTQYEGVDFLIGGSPCTYWSIAQTKNRETVASGMGWELFSQYVRALNESKPKYFIYENNKSMSKDIRASIDKAFGFGAVLINSALVSAQNRQRLYWVGKRNEDGTYSKVNVEQPADRGILLKDVLDSVVARDLTCNDKAYTLTATYDGACAWNTIERHQRNMVAEPVCLRYERTDEAKQCRKAYEAHEIKHGYNELNELHPRPDGKTNTLTTVLKDNQIIEPVCVAERGRMYCGQPQHYEARTDGKTNTLNGKAVAQTAQSGGMGSNTGLYAEPINVTADGKAQCLRATCYKDGIRNIIANEVDKKTGVAEPINVTDGSKSQTLKAQYAKNNVENFCCYTSTYGATGVAEPIEYIDYVPRKNSHIVVNENAIRCAQNKNNASCAESFVEFVDKKSQTLIAGRVNKIIIPAMPVKEATAKGYTEIECGDCVDLSMPNSKTRRGRSMADKANCMQTSNDFYQYVAYAIEFDDDGKPIKAIGKDGKEITIYEVKDGKITIKGKQYPIKLKDGFYIIRKLTVCECMRLQTVPEWYEFPVSDSQAYKMLGNGWTCEVIAHILKSLKEA